MRKRYQAPFTALALILPIFLGACMEERPSEPIVQAEVKDPALFGNQGIFGSTGAYDDSGIGVNSFLWRATLDTISFMPIGSADAFGGVIITDWYSPPEAPDERFKLNVYILGRALRADGIRVAVFREVKSPQGWVTSSSPQKAAIKIEDSILTRARQLRSESEALKKAN